MAIVVETYNQVVDKIITNVITNHKEQAKALWDTGANCCCIS